MVKLSIITINYNDKIGLKKTIESVISQNCKAFEYIVIDGASTDGSTEIIQNYAENFTYWVSERDAGIYNAMNKGIVKAKGDYVLFLNSGDVFYDKNTINSICKNFGNADILYGDVFKDVSKFQAKAEIKKIPSHLDFNFFYNDTLPHQCCFIKRTLFDEYGLYNEQLKITADWEFFIRVICKYERSYLHLNEVITIYDTGGLSSTPNLMYLHKEERNLIIDKHFSMFASNYATLNKLLYYSKFNSTQNLFRLIDQSNLLHKISGGFLRLFNSTIKT